MVWIKRNLFFVIGAMVSLALLVFAGYYNYTGWQHKVDEGRNLDSKYADLKRLNNQDPHPGSSKVDNIKLAREQAKEIRGVLTNAAKYFQAPAAIPSPTDATNITSSQFTAALRETINQMTRAAAGASVQLPPDFKFSFSQQLRLLTFAGSLEPLAVQLGEVKALCDVLIKTKVNSLDGIQRERVSPDDAAGPLTDYYTDSASQTNDLAVLTPYQITFRSFSHEIAQVLAGFANSPHGFIVQRIRVEPAPTTTLEQPGTAPGVQAPFGSVPAAPAYGTRPARRSAAEEDAAEAAMLRPDLFKSGGPSAAPRPAPAPAYSQPSAYPTTPGVRGGAQTVLNERQLRVTLLVQVVKLLPKK
jgi:hypothetical protein